MVPLGDLWTGECRAPGRSEGAESTELCNLGYARGRCARFPDNGGPDAVRFSVARPTGEAVSVRFAVERGYLPHEHGTLVFSTGGRCLTVPAPEGPLRRLAEAYLESYLSRKNFL
jgi:hypothetical protein